MTDETSYKTMSVEDKIFFKRLSSALLPSSIVCMGLCAASSENPKSVIVSQLVELSMHMFVNRNIKSSLASRAYWNMVRFTLVPVFIFVHCVVGGPTAPIYLWSLFSIIPVFFSTESIYLAAAIILVQTLANTLGMVYNDAPTSFVYQILYIHFLFALTNLLCYTFIADLQREKEIEFRNRMIVQTEMDKVQIANKSKTDFIAHLSHELRNSINGILCSLHLITNNLRDVEAYQHMIDDIEGNAALIMSLISNTLDIANIESGTLTIKKEPLRIVRVVETAASIMASSAFEKGLNVYVDCDPNIPSKLLGDETRIGQIVMNLFSNAIKYTSKGYVHLKCYQSKSDDNNIIIECTDTGIGISKEDIETKLFKPFVRMNEHNIFEEYLKNDKEKGYGLGLSICHQLAQAMHSTLTVSSEVGVGTTFTLSLKLPPYATEEVSPTSSRKTNYFQRNKAQVIVLSSDLRMNGILTKYLRHFKTSQIHITGKVSDFDAFDFEPETIVIVNDEPENNLDPLIEKYQQFPKIRWIFLTSSTSTSVIERSPKISNVLCKPLKLSHLEKALFPESSKLSQGSEEVLSPNTSPGNYSILVVEDNAVNRKVLHAMLKNIGLTNITLAVNGKEGFEKYKRSVEQNQRFHLILSDIVMAVMSGTDCCTQIRQYEKEHNLPPVPFVAVTANVWENDKFFEVGMNAVITKPIKVEELTNCVKQYKPSSSD